MGTRIQVASDLHLEHIWRALPGELLIQPDPTAHVLVLAGDIAVGTKAVDAFAHWPVPVLYVPGNHEYYHQEDMAQTLASMRVAAAGTSVHVLDRDEVLIGDVRFLGATMWTDYELHGSRRKFETMTEARWHMNDHSVIRIGGNRFRPQDALIEHEASRRWLASKLSKGGNGEETKDRGYRSTVVISHHGPHPGSVHARFAGDRLNPCFNSDLTSLMDGVTLWIHGHVHDCFDYLVQPGGEHGQPCRVVANPRGYPLHMSGYQGAARDIKFENPDFTSSLVLEV